PLDKPASRLALWRCQPPICSLQRTTQPRVELCLGQVGVGAGQQCALADSSAEEASPSVTDNLTWIVSCHQTASRQFICAELFGASHFNSTVHRSAGANAEQHAGDVVAGDWLNQH